MLRQILFGLCLALFSGMRPGEIFALQLKHIADDHVEVVHRIYRGKLDRPRANARNEPSPYPRQHRIS